MALAPPAPSQSVAPFRGRCAIRYPVDAGSRLKRVFFAYRILVIFFVFCCRGAGICERARRDNGAEASLKVVTSKQSWSDLSSGACKHYPRVHKEIKRDRKTAVAASAEKLVDVSLPFVLHFMPRIASNIM